MTLTKAERRKLKKQKRQEERATAASKQKKKNSVRNIVIGVVILIIIAWSVFSFISNGKKPGPLDEFAKCLSNEGLVIYGANWCSYTARQKNMFGKSDQFLNYRDYTETTGVTVTPTWEFEGKRYPRVQSLEFLSEITDCALP